jgi:hypothetical protein
VLDSGLGVSFNHPQLLIPQNATVFERNHAMRLPGQVVVVSHHYDRLSGSGEFVEDVGHNLTVATIEIAGRLIGQQHRRLIGEGSGDRHPLLFAAGEAISETRELVAQAQPGKENGASLQRIVARESAKLEHGETHVLLRSELFEQVMELEDKADLAISQRSQF